MPEKFVNFLKSRLAFNIHNLLSLNVCKETLHVSHVRIPQKVKSVLMQNIQHYFHMKILADFQICTSVPLKSFINSLFDLKFSSKVKP